MKLLTDENIATSVVRALRSAGHDILDVKEMKEYGISDQAIIQKAQKQKRIIVTHDKDFLLQNKVNVILLRFQNQNPKNTQARLVNFLKNKKLGYTTKNVQLIILSEFTFEIHRF